MTFSVIVPVHNAENFLEESLDSIVRLYSEALPFEVILVENGSTDNSPALCDSYEEKYGFVRCVHFGRIGAFRARREGMKAAEGEYLVFADADDKLQPDFFHEINVCRASWKDKGYEPDIILYNAGTLSNTEKKMFAFPFDTNRYYGKDDKEPFYEMMCSCDALNALWNKALRREFALAAIDDAGFEGADYKRFNHGEDLLQTAELLDRAEGIVYLDSILYLYRENAQGLTGSFHFEFLDNQADAWKAFDHYADKWAGNRFDEVIDRRKSLTCTIGMKHLIFSMMKLGDKKKEIKKFTDNSFYKEYYCKELPDWASEEDKLVHGMMTGPDSEGKLIRSGAGYKCRQLIKRALGR